MSFDLPPIPQDLFPATFPWEELREVTTVVTHAHCADGAASEWVLRRLFSQYHPGGRELEVRYFRTSYSTSRDVMPAVPGMLFCDMSPPAARVDEFVAQKTIVLDHHASARAVVEAHGRRGVYASAPGISGAVLAREMVKVVRPGSALFSTNDDFFLRCLGVYDTWAFGDNRALEDAALGAHAVASLLLDAPRPGRLDPLADAAHYFHTGVGALLVETTRSKAAELVQRAVKVGDFLYFLEHAETAVQNLAADLLPLDTLAVMLRIAHVSSPSKPFLPLPGGSCNDAEVRISLRSRGTKFDCGQIARTIHPSGGGHKGAGGFTFESGVAEALYLDGIGVKIADAVESLTHAAEDAAEVSP